MAGTRLSATAIEKLVGECELQLARGRSESEIIEKLVEATKKSRRQVKRWIDAANKRQIRRIQRRRPELVASSLAKLDLAFRLALSKVRYEVKVETVTNADGTLQTTSNGTPVVKRNTVVVPAPDTASMISAVSAQNRLLGLDAPARHEVLVANVEATLRGVVSLIRGHLPDKGARSRFAADLRELLSEQLAQRKEYLPDLELPSLPSTAPILDAEPVGISQEGEE